MLIFFKFKGEFLPAGRQVRQKPSKNPLYLQKKRRKIGIFLTIF